MNSINWEELKSLIKENKNETGKEVLVELEKNDGNINEYRLYNRLNAYYRLLSQTEKETGDDLIKIKYAIQCRETEYANAMQDDIQELKRCFDAKAYKSTLIMAGSILEAFLLDWLSEIDQEDYFKKTYCKKVVGDDGFLQLSLLLFGCKLIGQHVVNKCDIDVVPIIFELEICSLC